MNKLAIERRVQYGAEKMLDVSDQWTAGAEGTGLTSRSLRREEAAGKGRSRNRSRSVSPRSSKRLRST
jgi:hypothetical protein